MPVFRLKVPVEVRSVIRQVPPELKRKLRAALEDILDDPTCGKALKESLKVIGLCELDELESSIGAPGTMS